MNLWSDFDCEMHPVPLDLDTADRLLAGTVAPEDAPPGYSNVARLLESAAAEPTADRAGPQRARGHASECARKLE